MATITTTKVAPHAGRRWWRRALLGCGIVAPAWWSKRNPDGSYTYEAHGKRGQRIVVSPSARVVVVRFGTDMGGVDAWEDVIADVIARVR